MATRSAPAGAPALRAREGPQLTYLVKQLELAIRKEIGTAIRPIGMTTPQFTALSVLARHDGTSSADLGRRSFVTPQAANEMVSALDRKGLVQRHPDATNQRVLVLSLTTAGRQVFDTCASAVSQIEERMLEGLSGSERSSLRRLLGGCLDRLRG